MGKIIIFGIYGMKDNYHLRRGKTWSPEYSDSLAKGLDQAQDKARPAAKSIGEAQSGAMQTDGLLCQESGELNVEQKREPNLKQVGKHRQRY
jgi:hypothetical protein